MYTPGDFILTHGQSFISRTIRFAQYLQFRGERKQFAHWNHAAMIVSEDGDLVEALKTGVKRTNISKYKVGDYIIISPKATDDNRKEMVDFMVSSVGTNYGFITLIVLAINLIFHTKLFITYGNQMVCSGLVARALERANYIFPKPAQEMMPADLAEFFHSL